MTLETINVLFVCTGNICRSPTAHGLFEHLVASQGMQQQIRIDSAGTHGYHVGEAPDSRAQETALLRNIDLSSQRARQISKNDFRDFQYLIAMDEANVEGLRRFADGQDTQHVQLFMDFASRWDEREVPDPYYGGDHGFERVLDMVEDAAEGLLAHIKRQHFS
ncbi:MAG: phosphotyrosine protein phosphatase [Thiotrichales bacterium]|nr:MAG: phosphotyrosine protein phosphatase [Thiotrichales bacterium]